MALPIQRYLKVSMGDTSDLDQQIEQLRKCEVIKESDVKILCAKAREILGRNSGLLQILQLSFFELCLFDTGCFF